MSMIPISIVMSVYNEDSIPLKEAIDSMLNQTFKEFEFIIICDDPSNKRIISFLEKYEQIDKRINVYINNENIGLTKSLNRGLEFARGKYVARMDADDISFSNRLTEQYSYMEKHPDINACGSFVKYINSENVEVGSFCMPTSPQMIDALTVFDCPLVHPVAMFRRIIDGIPVRYDESYRYAQDFAFWSSMPKGTLYNIPKYLLNYRVSDSQISTKHKAAQDNCAKRIQMNNLKKNGLELCIREKEIYDVLFNNSEGYCVDSKDVLRLVSKLFFSLSTEIDMYSLYKVLCSYSLTFLRKRKYSRLQISYFLCKLLIVNKRYSLKYVIYSLSNLFKN